MLARKISILISCIYNLFKINPALVFGINILNIISICIGAGFYTKRWPAENITELIDKIFENRMGKVILLGGKVDEESADQITGGTKSEVLNLCGKLSLIESAAVIKSSNMVISNDTGLMHIAQALKKNLVAIFGSTTKELGYFPVGRNSVVIEKELYCRPCSHNGKEKCPEKHFRCMKDISPEEVFETIKNLIKVKS